MTQTADNSANPVVSKTDTGVAQQAQKENDRDNQDRFYLESRLEVLIDRMMGLFATIGTEEIPVDLFTDDFADINAAGFTDDLKKMMTVSESKQSARLTIKPSFFNKLSIRFQLDPNSTAASSKATQLQSLESFLQSMSSMQNEVVDMKAQGWTLDWALIAKLEEQLSDVPEMGKIFRQMTDQEKQLYQQQQEAQNPSRPPEMIDTTAFKDLPDWAKTQRLTKEGYQVPQGADMQTDETKLKTAEVAAKMHTATKEPAPAPEQPVTPAVVHRSGRIIKDPVVADAYNKMGDLSG